MGETLTFANERKAYTLTDRAHVDVDAERAWPTCGSCSAARRPRRTPIAIFATSTASSSSTGRGTPASTRRWRSASPTGCSRRPTQQRIGAFGRDTAGHSLFYPGLGRVQGDGPGARGDRREDRARSRSTNSRKAKQATLAGVEYIGVKKGALGRYTWTGASLKDLLLVGRPRPRRRRRDRRSTIEVVSSDGWIATLTWNELFGQVSRGEGLYRAKGCNECHGLRAEGTSPEGKRPAPKLLGEAFPCAETTAMIRDRHRPARGHHGVHGRPPVGRRPGGAFSAGSRSPARTGSADLVRRARGASGGRAGLRARRPADDRARGPHPAGRRRRRVRVAVLALGLGSPRPVARRSDERPAIDSILRALADPALLAIVSLTFRVTGLALVIATVARRAHRRRGRPHAVPGHAGSSRSCSTPGWACRRSSSASSSTCCSRAAGRSGRSAGSSRRPPWSWRRRSSRFRWWPR